MSFFTNEETDSLFDSEFSETISIKRGESVFIPNIFCHPDISELEVDGRGKVEENESTFLCKTSDVVLVKRKDTVVFESDSFIAEDKRKSGESETLLICVKV